MKILALDSSGLVASVAIVEEEQTIAEYTVNYKKTHSQTLLPMLDQVAQMIELDMDSIDAIAVAGGPGSFTGLRIGSATAKGLGLALKKPLIHIPTAEGMAYGMYGVSGLICPIMDARRSQVYTGLYEFTEIEEPTTNGHAVKEMRSARQPGGTGIYNQFHVVEDQMAIGVLDLIAKLNKLERPVTFLGDGVPVYKSMLEEGLRVPYVWAPAHCNRQSAAAVGALGVAYYQAGKIETAVEHEPDYLRVSQAERERAERLSKEEK